MDKFPALGNWQVISTQTEELLVPVQPVKGGCCVLHHPCAVFTGLSALRNNSACHTNHQGT